MPAPLQILRPYDRSLLAELPTDDATTLEQKLTLAATTFKNRTNHLKTHQRIAILQKTATLLEAHQSEFATRIAEEGGKPRRDATVEVTRAIDGTRNAAEALRTFAGTEIPMGITPASDARYAFTTREPIGPVAAISAFNHPLNLIVHHVAPAIAVGSPVIIKPAATTPLSCLAFVQLLRDAGLPEGWCQTLITDDNILAEKLATDPRIAFLSFIGSAKVGWHLRSKLPPGTRCALEHGGAAPVIIDRSADIPSLIEPITKGGYYHAGQVCVSVQRIFVHESLQKEFTDQFAARVATLITGDPTLEQTDVGPLILPRELTRVKTWVNEAVNAGTKLLGGQQLSNTTLAPAILLNPPSDAKVSQLEVFGPLTCIYPFTALDDAITRANALPYSFQSSIFATDINAALRAAEYLDAATVLINDHTAFRTDWMPFAGHKHSGYGVGGIPYTMREMSKEKMIVLKRN